MGAITGTPLWQLHIDRNMTKRAENAFSDYFDDEARQIMDPQDKLAVIHALRALTPEQRALIEYVATHEAAQGCRGRGDMYDEIARTRFFVCPSTARKWARRAWVLYALERGLV